MDCQAILDNELHEQYLLNQLPANRKAEFKAHLQTCPACKKELVAQQRLIGAIRQVGRQKMKAEIRQQAARQQPASPGMNWMIMSRVAAALVMLILAPTLIYVYNTTVPKHESVSMKRPELSEIPADPKLDSPADTEFEELRLPEPPPVLLEEEPAAAAHPAPASPPRQMQPPLEPRLEVVVPLAKKQLAREKTEPETEVLDRIESEDETNAATVQGASEKEVLSKVLRVSQAPYSETKTTLERAGARSRALAPPPPVVEMTLETRGRQPGPPGHEFVFDHQKTLEATSERDSPPMRAQWQFKHNGTVIVVNLHHASVPPPAKAEAHLPSSFPVEIVRQDSLGWEMNWSINAAFLKLDPAEMRLKLAGPSLNVILQSELLYTIGLGSRLTKAVRVR
ncbi:MAG: anti-sigma factor family protein [bacterium]